MSDQTAAPDALAQKISEATTRLVDIQREIADLDGSARAHEHEARECIRKREALKKEGEQLQTVLRHTHVQKAVDDSRQAAARAQASAEANEKKTAALLAAAEAGRAELDRQSAELTALLARAKEPAPTPPE